MPKTLEQVAAEMNARFTGTAYPVVLAFDAVRMHGIHSAVLEMSIPECVMSEHTTLDMGCGECGIAGFWPHQNIVAVDISEVAIEKSKLNFPDVIHVVSPAEQFEWKGDPFCVAVAQEAIEHWVDVPAALSALRKNLRRGAVFVVSTPNRDSLHCRIGRKFNIDIPFCSSDHIHEFHYQELIDEVCSHGFAHRKSRGVGMFQDWALESICGKSIRSLTDNDTETNLWLNEIARYAPAEYAFIQVHRFIAV